MHSSHFPNALLLATLLLRWNSQAPAADLTGTVKSVDVGRKTLVVTLDGNAQEIRISVTEWTQIGTSREGLTTLAGLKAGMTASRKLKDLKAAGWRFVAFGLLAPNLFAAAGIAVAIAYRHAIARPFDLGTYVLFAVLFAVLCGAASYIAVPAIQRLAIPEASPTLPLAASFGLTFSYDVTVGIPIYIEIAKLATRAFPVGS